MFEIDLSEIGPVFQAIQNTLKALNSTIPKITLALGMLMVVGCKNLGLDKTHAVTLVNNLYEIAHTGNTGLITFPGKITFIQTNEDSDAKCN